MNSVRVLGLVAPALAGVFFALGVLLLPAQPAHAVPAVTSAAGAGGLELLRLASDAWRTGNFRGRLMYVHGNRVDSMQVLHAVFDGVEYERISHLDDAATEVIRRGDDTVSVHSGKRMTQFDAAGSAGSFRPFAAIDAELGKVYSVQRKDLSRVAGRTADFLEIVPRDAHRYGYRVWLDTLSHLPLRYEILGRNGKALESVEFVDIETGVAIPREMFDAPGGGRTATITRAQEAPMPAVVPAWLPEGFRVTGSRQHQGEGQQKPVSAVTYSDGIAAFSFFVEQATAEAKPMGRQVGPTVVVSGVLQASVSGRYLVTLVGELPPGTAVKIVESARLAKPAQVPVPPVKAVVP